MAAAMLLMQKSKVPEHHVGRPSRDTHLKVIFGSLPVLGSVHMLLGSISGLYRTPLRFGPHRKDTGPVGSRQQATSNEPQERPGPDPKRQPPASDRNTHPQKVYFRGPTVELLPHLALYRGRDQMYSFRNTLRECYALGSWSHDRQVPSLFGATRVKTLGTRVPQD